MVLKVSEGVSEFLMKMTLKELNGTLDTEKAKGQRRCRPPAPIRLQRQAGPLLGIDGICIICHGVPATAPS